MGSVPFETHTHDVVVIGAGGAGLRAAIEVAEQGLTVALVCKSLLGKAHTVMAEGGCAASLGNVDPEDHWEPHFKDTMRGGKFLNNFRMAELHARESADRVKELEKWGAVFDRTADGKILQRAFGGHTYRRLAHVGDRTGLELIRTLQDKGVHSNIDVFMECTATHFVKDGERISGAVAYWRENGKMAVFRGKSFILATGGVGKMYKVTSNSWEYTADGHGMAVRAGADMIDLDFIQFHPTGMVWPPGVAGILVTEAVRGEGGLLTNSKGERFMENYDPKRMELSTRDIVAKAINSEVKAGRGSPHGGVFLDISHRGEEFVKKKLPSMFHQFKELADVDITKGPMEVGPTTHYTMGGLRVEPDTTACPRVPGLFACGEVAAGMHGANRLGGNSLSDLIVFGRRAGIGAIDFAKANALPPLDESQVQAAIAELAEPFERESGENPYTIHADLKDLMQTKAGIVKNEEDLKSCLEDLKALQKRALNTKIGGSKVYNPGWHLCHDIKNLLMVAEGVVKSALQRQESRGGHTRVDFPEYDPFWQKNNSACHLEGDELKVYTTPLPEMPEELKKLFDDGEVS